MGANFESMANFQAVLQLSLHISFRADTLLCLHADVDAALGRPIAYLLSPAMLKL
jgi:hypothetical protein